MDKRKNKTTDRHVNSKTFTLRLDTDLYNQFYKVAEKQGKSRSSIMIALIEEYLSKNGDEKSL